MWLHTFSITARDPDTGEFGVAVATAVPAVGALVPHVSLKAAVATQSYANFALGPQVLSLVEQGIPAATAMRLLLEADERRELRQVAVVDALGDPFAYTGSECVPWAGHRIGRDFVVAGNMLTGPETVDAMAETYTREDGLPFADRLLKALEAGQKAGGDKRGKQSAALLIASPEPQFFHNLRVDLHVDPVAELVRIFGIAKASAHSRAQTYRQLETPIRVKW